MQSLLDWKPSCGFCKICLCPHWDFLAVAMSLPTTPVYPKPWPGFLHFLSVRCHLGTYCLTHPDLSPLSYQIHRHIVRGTENTCVSRSAWPSPPCPFLPLRITSPLETCQHFFSCIFQRGRRYLIHLGSKWARWMSCCPTELVRRCLSPPHLAVSPKPDISLVLFGCYFIVSATPWTVACQAPLSYTYAGASAQAAVFAETNDHADS